MTKKSMIKQYVLPSGREIGFKRETVYTIQGVSYSVVRLRKWVVWKNSWDQEVAQRWATVESRMPPNERRRVAPLLGWDE